MKNLLATGSLLSFRLRTLVAALVFASSGCASEEDEIATKCERLRNHIVELRTEGLPEADRAAHASALEAALGATNFMAECKAMKAQQINCALAADEPSALTSCASQP
jgi:hypothetical protein